MEKLYFSPRHCLLQFGESNSCIESKRERKLPERIERLRARKERKFLQIKDHFQYLKNSSRALCCYLLLYVKYHFFIIRRFFIKFYHMVFFRIFYSPCINRFYKNFNIPMLSLYTYVHKFLTESVQNSFSIFYRYKIIVVSSLD